MRIASLLVIIIACCAVTASAVAMPLGSAWPWEALTRTTGWRFHRDFVTWPGDYWRGPNQPPLIADVDTPETWGILRLGGRCDTAPAPLAEVHELVAPLSNNLPLINGSLGYEEWSEAAQIIQRGGDGEAFVLLAQRTGQALHVALALPAVFALRQNQIAELLIDTAPGQALPLGPQHLRLRASASRSGHATLQAFSGDSGRWSQERVKQPRPGVQAPAGQWHAALAATGDGAWHYLVAEFAIPYTELFGAAQPPAAIGLMARLQSEAGTPRVSSIRAPRREALYWPDSRSEYDAATEAPLSLRPDFWGAIIMSANDPRHGLSVPAARQKVIVDGQLGLKEWKGASRAEYHFPGDQWRVLWAQQDQDNLYLAIRLRAARGQRQNETCGLYLDPCGDGGLRPRPDDVLYRLPLGVQAAVEAFTYQDSKWRPIGAAGLLAASYPLNAYESCYEFAIPRGLMTGPMPPSLAVEVSYQLPSH